MIVISSCRFCNGFKCGFAMLTKINLLGLKICLVSVQSLLRKPLYNGLVSYVCSCCVPVLSLFGSSCSH